MASLGHNELMAWVLSVDMAFYFSVCHTIISYSFGCPMRGICLIQQNDPHLGHLLTASHELKGKYLHFCLLIPQFDIVKTQLPFWKSGSVQIKQILHGNQEIAEMQLTKCLDWSSLDFKILKFIFRRTESCVLTVMMSSWSWQGKFVKVIDRSAATQ